jgi:hypothetical protein
VYGYNAGSNFPIPTWSSTSQPTAGDIATWDSAGNLQDGGAPGGGGGSAALTTVYNTTHAATNATITATTMTTPGSDTWYKANFYAIETTVGTGCTGSTNIVANVVFQDPSDSTGRTFAVKAWTIATNGTANSPLPTAASTVTA